jgi:hypothetical protein
MIRDRKESEAHHANPLKEIEAVLDGLVPR